MTSELATLIARVQSTNPDDLQPKVLRAAVLRLREEARGPTKAVYMLCSELLDAAADLIENLQAETGEG